jgi:glyoxylase-like metal-dependent hydrolase (beta-lactamase superfamily II)/rhodanese-related sulfurtransferase
MYFKQFIADALGCASYLIGDMDAGECVVVDPSWNIEGYLKTAGNNGMRIVYVIETHNHADHVSGHGKLAALGAKVAIFEGAGVEYPHKALVDGESIGVGTVRFTALHTPGHRPEHIAVAVTDTTRAGKPWLVLTGDSLFVGDVGRPDLAVEPREGAAELFHSLHDKLLSMQDGVEVYPAHVSGSLCGKSMSPKGSSTIGFERLYNLPLLEESEQDFVELVTGELPPQPPQFERIVARNRGPFLTEEILAVPMGADDVEAMKRGGALLLDTRSPEAFGGGHVPGALNVDLHGGQFATRASWMIPEKTPVILVLESQGDLEDALEAMSMVGQDGIVGYLLGGMQAWAGSGRLLETIPQTSTAELRHRIEAGDRSFQVIDVRDDSEWHEGHIPGAIHIPFHQLLSHLDEVPSNKPVATICAGGTRSSIAASILKAHGFDPVNVVGGMSAWTASTVPLSESQVK